MSHSLGNYVVQKFQNWDFADGFLLLWVRSNKRPEAFNIFDVFIADRYFF